MSVVLIDQAIGETLATINGTAPYTHNLSRSGQVVAEKRARPPEGARDQVSACYWTASVTESASGMPAWQSTGVWVITVWTRPFPAAAARRRRETMELLHDVRKAFRANPRLRTGGADQVTTMVIEAQPYDVESQAEGASVYGVLVVSLTLTWRERP